MADRRKRNVNWWVAEEDGTVPSWDRAAVAVLMDIRDELQILNRLLACPNFTGIPETLRTIARHTKRKKKPRLKVVKRRAA